MNDEEIFARQLREGREFRGFLEATRSLLFRHNPLGHDDRFASIYHGEACEILEGLRQCQCEADVTRLVHRVFVGWAAEEAGPLQKYEQIGKELWELWGSLSA